jgi:hypothetical protein
MKLGLGGEGGGIRHVIGIGGSLFIGHTMLVTSSTKSVLGYAQVGRIGSGLELTCLGIVF